MLSGQSIEGEGATDSAGKEADEGDGETDCAGKEADKNDDVVAATEENDSNWSPCMVVSVRMSTAEVLVAVLLILLLELELANSLRLTSQALSTRASRISRSRLYFLKASPR